MLKKTKSSKMVLSIETLRALTEHELNVVAGGLQAKTSKGASCNCSDDQGDDCVWVSGDA